MVAKFYKMTEEQRKKYLFSCSQDKLVQYAQNLMDSLDENKKEQIRQFYSPNESFNQYVLNAVNFAFPVKPELKFKKKSLLKKVEEIEEHVGEKAEKHKPRNEGWLG
jgi:hypothetical protein